MFYNKQYVLSDYLNYNDLNELVSKIKELLNYFGDIINTDDTARYNKNMVEYNINDFPYIEDIDIIEKNIMNIGFDFYQPAGYINNKVWIEDDTQATYKNISYLDLNRIITDINLLYENKNNTPTIYNLYTHEEWNTGVSSLEWEE